MMQLVLELMPTALELQPLRHVEASAKIAGYLALGVADQLAGNMNDTNGAIGPYDPDIHSRQLRSQADRFDDPLRQRSILFVYTGDEVGAARDVALGRSAEDGVCLRAPDAHARGEVVLVASDARHFLRAGEMLLGAAQPIVVVAQTLARGLQRAGDLADLSEARGNCRNGGEVDQAERRR